MADNDLRIVLERLTNPEICRAMDALYAALKHQEQRIRQLEATIKAMQEKK